MTELAVVLVAPAAGDGPGVSGLVPRFGPARVAHLRRVLVARTARWVLDTAAPGAAYVALPRDAGTDGFDDAVDAGLEPFAPRGAHPGERRAGAMAEAARRTGLPVVAVTALLPALGAHHAWAVADDLGDGIDVTFGPSNHGDTYLVAAREPYPAPFAIDPAAWGTERVMGLALEAAVAAGLSVGWLRSERGLESPEDAAALLADPRTPADLLAALRD